MCKIQKIHSFLKELWLRLVIHGSLYYVILWLKGNSGVGRHNTDSVIDHLLTRSVSSSEYNGGSCSYKSGLRRQYSSRIVLRLNGECFPGFTGSGEDNGGCDSNCSVWNHSGEPNSSVISLPKSVCLDWSLSVSTPPVTPPHPLVCMPPLCGPLEVFLNNVLMYSLGIVYKVWFYSLPSSNSSQILPDAPKYL